MHQSDLNERSEQVRMVSEIYKRSQGNLIHLGEVKHHDQTGAALADLRAVLVEMNAETETLTKVAGTSFDPSRSLTKGFLANT